MKSSPVQHYPLLSNKLLGALMALSIPAGLYAQSTIGWDGSDSTAWATGTNWTGDLAPTSDLVSNIALFNQATYTNQPNAGTTSIAGVQIGDGSTSTGALTLSGTALTIGSSGINMLANAGAATVSSPINLGAAQSWTNNSSSVLTASGTVATGGFLLSSGGSGNTTMSGVISGTGSLAKSGSGTLTLSGLNTFTGNITISSGTLAAGIGITGNTTTSIASNFGDLGTASGARSITINNGGTLSLTNGNVLGTGGSTGALPNLTLAVNEGGVFQTGLDGSGVGWWNKVGAVNLNGGTIKVGSGANTSSFQGLALIGTVTVGGTATTASSIENFASSNSTSNAVHLGQNGASTITFNVADVTGSAASDLNVSVRLHNTSSNQNAGSLNKTGAGTMTLSANNTYTGTTTVSAGTLNVTGSLSTGSVNVAGGTMNLSGSLGTNATNGGFKVATVTNTPAVLNILTGTVANNRLNLFVGDAGAGTGGGAVYQSGGSLTLTQTAGIDNLRVGSNAGGYGYYKLSGGSLTTNEAGIGASLAGTTGVMDVTGGTFTSNGYITIGRGSTTSSGVLSASGGSVAATRIHLNYAGTSGATSVFNVGGGGGAATVGTTGSATVGLDLANTTTAGTIGVANLLSNGTLTTGIVTGTQANPTALLNFNGGTLKAAATNAGVTFLASANVDAVTVYSGGGTIDNNGTSITVGNALSGATGNGVTSIAVTNGGSGYLGSPMVKITGSNGNAATGYAVMTDDGTGAGTYKVSSIVITSPGTFTVDPTAVTLTGGGATTAATTGTITTAVNTSGGMTFSGTGTTTLSGANTYTGGTTVSAGTLDVTGTLADSGAVNVNGGTYKVSNDDTVGVVTLTSGTISNATGKVLTGSSYAVQSGTVSGILGGSGVALTKSTAGTVTLSGANTYSGDTTISAGTLALASSGSIANSANIVANGTFDVSAVSGFTVGSSQTLKGSGIVTGATIVNGTLAPGNSPGLLTFSSDLTLGGSSTSQFEINGSSRGSTFDAVNVGGTLTYNGTLSLFFNAPISAGTYDLFGGSSGGSPTSVAGDFGIVSVSGGSSESFSSGPVFQAGIGWTASSTNWTYAFDNATGDLTISAIPEPSAFAALAGLAGLGLAASRRRRRVAV